MLKKKLKLSSLSEAVLKDKEMKSIFGGNRICSCSCSYEGQGGSTSENNKVANYSIGDEGGYSTTGCNQYHMSYPPTSGWPSPSVLNESIPG